MNILHHTHFNKPPMMFAAWSGSGNVGLLAVDYLRRKLEAHLFAQIDMSQFVTPESIVVKNGVAHFPELPQSVFYHYHDPDLVIFECNAIPGGMHDMEIMKAMLELAKELKTPRIYTAAAIPQSISHSVSPQLLYACNNAKMVGELEKYEASPMLDGTIAGLNGLLLGFAAAHGIDAACLLATIPAYAQALTYPRGAFSIVNTLQKIIGIRLDTDELEQDIRAADPMFAEIEDKIREFFSSATQNNEEPPQVEHEDLPGYVMDRIEELFKAAKQDKSRAEELKKELDKWDLYKLYEDRFLDLFENNDEQPGRDPRVD